MLATGSHTHQRSDEQRPRCRRSNLLLISNEHNQDYVKYHSVGLSFSFSYPQSRARRLQPAAVLKGLRAPGPFGSSALCACLINLGVCATLAPAVIPSASLRNHCFRYAVLINEWCQCCGAKCFGFRLSARGAGQVLRFKPACRGAAALAFPLVLPRHGFAALLIRVADATRAAPVVFASR